MNHRTQDCPIKISKDNYVAVIFMDLTNTCDAMVRDILILKFRGYDFYKQPFSLMKNNLTERQERVSTNNNSSTCANIISEDPQG